VKSAGCISSKQGQSSGRFHSLAMLIGAADGRELRCCGFVTSEDDDQHCRVVICAPSSRCVDPDLGRWCSRSISWGAAAPESLDDDHATAAARTWVGDVSVFFFM
jgi:hypothetical protein